MSKKAIFAVLLIAIVLPVTVMAATVSLPETGQTTSYATGDDGELQRGVAWPSPRFTAATNTVTDNLTGLMWTQDANLPAATKTWQAALDYVTSMNTGAGTYGYTDWRLPNRKELESLVNAGQANPATWLNSQGFSNVQSNDYWSSTSYAYYTSHAWIVCMYDGYVGAYGKSDSNYVWPVRSGHVDSWLNLAILKSGMGFGTVTSSPAGINCGSTCSAVFYPETSVTLTESPTAPSTFVDWSDGCTGTASTCTVTMSAAKSVTATFTQICTYVISPTSKIFTSSGGTDTVSVTVNTGCTWSATSNVDWITINSGSSGNGNGTVSYTVSANTPTSQRTGTLTIAGQTFTVTQDGQSCPFSISPTTIATIPSTGGSGTITLTTPSSTCVWTATSNASTWLTVSPASGTGIGTVTYTVSANTSTSQRTGTLTIAGRTFTVTQDGVPCSYSLTPTSKTFTSAAGTGSVNITTPSNCTWTAASNATWITITSNSSGSGNATVNYSVTENTGYARTGTLTIGGQTLTVSQTGPDCATGTSISPISKHFGYTGGSDTVSVTPPNSTCRWTSTSNVTWITITSGEAGTGNGQVSYTVAESTEAAPRTGTMTIAGQTFTVTQDTHSHLKVTMTGSGIGSVSPSTGTLSWSSDGKTGTAVYNKDTQVVLTATPAQGVKLKAWTGCNATESNQCTVKMTTDRDVTVEFFVPITPIYDFDGNGKSDVLWRNTKNGGIYIWLMNATQIVGGDYVVEGITEKWDIKGVADFNGDGKSDIIWQHKDEGDVYMYIMDGTKIITHGYAMRGLPKEWEFKAAGDFDGHGKADILWQNSETGDTAVWFMDGKDIKGTGFIVRGMSSEWVIRVVADLNGDKKDDIVWQNTKNGDVFVWLMDWATILKGGYASPGVPGNWKAKAVADFDGDGKADILWQDTTSGDVAIWMMDGTSIVGGGLVVGGMLNWHVLAVADYNGDGRSDVLWQNTGDGGVFVWFMDGTTITSGSGYVVNGMPSEWQAK